MDTVDTVVTNPELALHVPGQANAEVNRPERQAGYYRVTVLRSG
jgi:hypothetical protein